MVAFRLDVLFWKNTKLVIMFDAGNMAKHKRLAHSHRMSGPDHRSSDFKKMLRFYKTFGFDTKAAREWTERTLTAFEDADHELAGA